jgi:hypothetical protein
MEKVTIGTDVKKKDKKLKFSEIRVKWSVG